MKRLIPSAYAALILGIALVSVGCGSDGKDSSPKAPADAPKLEQKMPSGGGGGGKAAGPNMKSE